MMTIPAYLTVGQAARELQVLECQVRAVLRRDPTFPRIHVGRTSGIDPEDLLRLRAALLDAGYLQPEESHP
jgi:hypothetical protein